MSKLTVQTGNDNPVLRNVSKKVEKVDKSIVKLVRDMEETMHAEKGVGLAAPQVGVNRRVILVLLNVDTAQEMILPMINPEIVLASDETEVGEEGCLSLPKIFDNVRRSKEITVQFRDVKGREQFLKLNDFNARVVQHEIDHLNGVLFTDHVEKVAAPLPNAEHRQL